MIMQPVAREGFDQQLIRRGQDRSAALHLQPFAHIRREARPLAAIMQERADAVGQMRRERHPRARYNSGCARGLARGADVKIGRFESAQPRGSCPAKKKLSPGVSVAAKYSSSWPSLRPLLKRTSSIGASTMIPAFSRCWAVNLRMGDAPRAARDRAPAAGTGHRPAAHIRRSR